MKYDFIGEEADIFMDIIFLMGSILDINLLGHRVLQQMGKLIPYKQAVFFLYNEAEGHFSPCASVRCENFFIETYMEKFYRIDYLHWQFCQCESKVVCESAEMDWEKRESSEFYKYYLKPNNLKYRLCFNLVSEEKELLGVIMFYRSEVFNDFSEREMEISSNLQIYFTKALENAKRYEQFTLNEALNQLISNGDDRVLFLLDWELRLRYTSKSAESYLQAWSQDLKIWTELKQKICNHCIELKNNYLQHEFTFETDKIRMRVEEEIILIEPIIPHPLSHPKKLGFLITLESQMKSRKAECTHAVKDNFRECFLKSLYQIQGLTKRETEVMGLALEGLNNEEIARKLYISANTVKSHFQNGYAKLALKSRKDLFMMFNEYSTSHEFRETFDTTIKKEVTND